MKDLLPSVSPAEIQRQLKKLGTEWKATKSNLIYATQRNLIPQPISGHRGGKGVKSIRPGETAAELHANRELFKAALDGGYGLTLDQVRIVRELARTLYDAVIAITPGNFKNFNRTINRLSDVFEGKEFFAVPIMYWLNARRLALIDLYGEDVVDNHTLWFFPELLTDFITYLCRGLMRSWTMDGKGKIHIEPEKDDDVFARGCAERTSTALAAKPQE